MKDAHILIAENDEKIRRSLHFILRQAGYRVTVVSDCMEALHYLTSVNGNGQVDLVLTDILMPGSSGLDTVKKLKQADHKTPILVLTGYRDEAVKKKLIQAGCNCFIEKPFEPDVLISRVHGILSQPDNHNQSIFYQ